MYNDNDYALLATRDHTKIVENELEATINMLDLDDDHEFELRLILAKLKGINAFLEKKGKAIESKRA